MAAGAADTFQAVMFVTRVPRISAKRWRGSSRAFEARKTSLNWFMSGVGEQERGIVCRDRRGTAHHAVAARVRRFSVGRALIRNWSKPQCRGFKLLATVDRSAELAGTMLRVPISLVQISAS